MAKRRSGTNNRDLRIRNRLLVRNTIRESGPIARYEISKAMGLTPPTVTVIVNQLIAEGAVQEIGTGESSGGRRPVMLAINPRAASVFAVRVQRGEAITALIDVAGNIIGIREIRLDALTPEDLARRLVSELSSLLDATRVPRESVLWCGVASPGLVNPATGVVERSTNLAWTHVPFGPMLSEGLGGIPVHVENISNAAAIAEMEYGCAKGCGNLVYVNLSVGIGAGVIADRQVFGGARGYAGEIGHMALEMRDGAQCSCGRDGCFEAYCGLGAVMDRLRGVLSEDVCRSHGVSRAELSIADVLNTSIYDAPKVREVLDDVAYMVGIAVSNLICLLNPDMVVLGGELAQAGDRFVGTVSRTAEARAIGEMSSMCRIVKSVMQQDPPLMGAYLLALGHVLTMDAWPS